MTPLKNWKISVERAAVPAKIMGGQGRPPHQQDILEAIFSSRSFKYLKLFQNQRAWWHRRLAWV